jgi:hypothetical protein
LDALFIAHVELLLPFINANGGNHKVAVLP